MKQGASWSVAKEGKKVMYKDMLHFLLEADVVRARLPERLSREAKAEKLPLT
jgi:hypothetical protein